MESFGIIRLVGIIIYLYFLWKNLRKDYEEEKIIELGWISVLAFLVGGRLGYGLINWGVWKSLGDWFLVYSVSGFDYIIAGVFFWISIFLWSKLNDIGKLVIADNIVLVFWLMVVMFLMDEYVRSIFDTRVIGLLIASILSMGGGYVVTEKYRSFSWYKSGKKGFVYFFSVILFFLINYILSFIFDSSWKFNWLFVILGLIFGVGLSMLGDVWILNTPKNWWLQLKDTWKKKKEN